MRGRHSLRALDLAHARKAPWTRSPYDNAVDGAFGVRPLGREDTHVKRVCKFLIVALAVAVVAGFTYEQVGRTRERERAPHQVGRSVDLGGRTLNIYCSGEGSPAVIFESGGNDPGYDWVLVQPEVARMTRACWYDRAGVGWSDPPPVPPTSATIANDLHELLRAAGVPPPYVLVGQSIGGEYVRVVAGKYPAEVAGMVLVDSSHPDQQEPPVMKSPANRVPKLVREAACLLRPALVRFGIVRWISGRSRTFAPPQMSAEEQRVYVALRSRATADATAFGQWCRGTNGGADMPDRGTGNPEIDDAARASGSLGDRPLLVLTAGKDASPPDPVAAQQIAAFHTVWVNQLQSSLARLSTRGRQIVVANSGHGMQVEAPDALVRAVNEQRPSAISVLPCWLQVPCLSLASKPN